MKVYDDLIDRCRVALTGQWVRRGAAVLALTIVVIQFSLVQHSIEAGPEHGDIACEFCVAGDHHSPPISIGVSPTPDFSAAPLSVRANDAPRAVLPIAAHRVRAPPVIT